MFLIRIQGGRHKVQVSFARQVELPKPFLRSQMDLGEGIALNEALRENLFMLLVSAGCSGLVGSEIRQRSMAACKIRGPFRRSRILPVYSHQKLQLTFVEVMNQIPILLIGKPGCSKSLAMGVLQNNLNGEAPVCRAERWAVSWELHAGASAGANKVFCGRPSFGTLHLLTAFVRCRAGLQP